MQVELVSAVGQFELAEYELSLSVDDGENATFVCTTMAVGESATCAGFPREPSGGWSVGVDEFHSFRVVLSAVPDDDRVVGPVEIRVQLRQDGELLADEERTLERKPELDLGCECEELEATIEVL